MKPSNLFNSDDRAVSPVIGVILMVAITVILAAVIGTFVLGLGDSLGDSQPTAQLDVSFDTDTDTVTIEHNGGDRIDSDSLEVIVSNASGTESNEGTVSPALTVGDSVEASVNGGSNTTDVRVRIIHTPSDSIILDRTEELASPINIGNSSTTDYTSP
ncbi:hypothetical protein DJ82_05225 [Halorubrum sp. Ib24]|uniref:type IV pilin n=1 Tax=unclassified Halorubrum TaxID=2642239 RepID=UPI000B97F1FC|nr:MULTISPECIES: type IV pilin N-terminal domain-containing protein [unclassified Halorubrum]OYR41459.1 hypothetical protein DJ82_05225 [Halorubrum sp. Ib24]OYR54770.1 hypothetical protein DJ73_04535 [Halorubrum sp. Ea1]